MSFLLVAAAVGVVTFLWVRVTRQNRQRWLHRLDLPGVWHWAERGGRLELSGDLDGGRYRIDDPDGEERGEWSLHGHKLELTPESAETAQFYELRFFDEGKIGIDGPGRERRVYAKERSNVVPLKRRS